MSSDGRLVITVPWSARVHDAPADFRRWTPEGMRMLLGEAGLTTEEWGVRGTDWTVICNKLIVATARRTLRPVWGWLWFVPAAIVVSLAAIAGQICLRMNWGIGDDPLGYWVVAKRSRPE
jgi:hypothetical protein